MKEIRPPVQALERGTYIHGLQTDIRTYVIPDTVF
jgi:hypothetical protein